MTAPEPRLLADESCDFALVRALRQKGYHVKAVVEAMPGASDLQVLKAALEEHRVLVTEDKDFGGWVFAREKATACVVFLRFPTGARQQMIQAIVELVSNHGRDLENRYVVLEPGRARIRALKRDF